MKFFSLLTYVKDVVHILETEDKIDKQASGKLLSGIVSPQIILPVIAALPVISYVVTSSKLDFSSVTKDLSKLSELIDTLTGKPAAKPTTTTPLPSSTTPISEINSLPSGQGKQYGLTRKTPAALGLTGKIPAKGSYTQEEADQIQYLVNNGLDTTASKTKMNPRIEELIRSKATEYGISPDIAVKIAIVESGGNPNAISSTGAIGVFQFTGASAGLMGLGNRFNVYDNIDAGIRLIAEDKRFVGKFDSDVATYLALQIGGPNAKHVLSLDRSTKISDLPARVQSAVRGNLGGKSATIGEYIDVNAAALETKISAQQTKPVYKLSELNVGSKTPAAPQSVMKPPVASTVVSKEISPTPVKPMYRTVEPSVQVSSAPVYTPSSPAQGPESNQTLEGLIRHKSGLYFNAS